MLDDVSVRLSVRLSVTEVHWRIIANWAIAVPSVTRCRCCRCLARSAKLPEGLYILPMFFRYFFFIFF